MSKEPKNRSRESFENVGYSRRLKKFNSVRISAGFRAGRIGDWDVAGPKRIALLVHIMIQGGTGDEEMDAVRSRLTAAA